MIKLLITAALIYGIYKFFIAPTTALGGRSPQDELHSRASADNQATDDDGEYVDYEELD